MKVKKFTDELNKVQELMSQEKYAEAITLLEGLKKIEKQGNFKYSLTHKLYQLDSNAQSLFNQQKILGLIFELSQQNKSIDFTELRIKLKEKEQIELDEPNLRREIEILILRELLPCKIDEDKIVF
ncbi:MAG: hypothetical protein ACFFGP_12140 [Promethearchaeota archaeon]